MTQVPAQSSTAPTLPTVLRDTKTVEFWQRTDSFHGAHERSWPDPIYEALLLAEVQWRDSIGRIVIVARQTANVMNAGSNWCVVKLHYDRVAEQIEAPSPSGDERTDSSQASVSHGVDQGEAAVRQSFGASMCWRP